ncbi:MAG TPA: hypothetical protein VL588_10750, partial [Bdellovibrionota bacterium]|nr:hypothetical protein [Bdellovibrionota bacterium]
GGRLLLTLAAPKKPTLVAELSGEGKLEHVYALQNADGTQNSEMPKAILPAGDDRLNLALENGVATFALRKHDVSYQLAYSDWLERNLGTLKAMDSGVSAFPPAAPESPGDIRSWTLSWIRPDTHLVTLPKGRLLHLDRTPRGDLMAWTAESVSEPGHSAVRAWRLDGAGGEPLRTEHLYYLPSSYDRDLSLTVQYSTAPGQVILFAAYSIPHGKSQVARLTPWGGNQDVVAMATLQGRVASLGFDGATDRLWVTPAPDRPAFVMALPPK